MPSLTPSTGTSPRSQITHLAAGAFAAGVLGLWGFAIRSYGGITAGLLLGAAIAGTIVVAIGAASARINRRVRRDHAALEAALAARHEQTLVAVKAVAAGLENLTARVDQINTEYPSDLAMRMYTDCSAMWSQQIVKELADVLTELGHPDRASNIRQLPQHRRRN